MIIQTTANQLYRVRETGNPDLAHVWFGIAVKAVKGAFVDRKNAREELVRKVGTVVVSS